MVSPVPNCFMLLKQAVWRALARAWAKTGKRIAARMAMMAMTTSNSISVNPRFGIGTVSFPVIRFITIEFTTKKCTPFRSSQQLRAIKKLPYAGRGGRVGKDKIGLCVNGLFMACSALFIGLFIG